MGFKEKGKVRTLDIAFRETSPHALRYGTCTPGISKFYLHTHTFIRNRNEPPAFAFPAIAGTHLPTLEGWMEG